MFKTQFLFFIYLLWMDLFAMSKNIGPVPNPTTSYWLSDNPPYQHTRSTPKIPKQNKMIVVGAGIAGCSAAYQLVQMGIPVTLIDARGVSGGATGRNSGGTGIGISFSSDMEKYGFERTRQLLYASAQQYQDFIDLHDHVCTVSKQSCWLRDTGTFDGFLDEAAAEKSKREIQAQQAAGLGENISFWDKVDCNNRTGASQLAGCQRNFWGGNAWPAKFVFAMVTVALDTGLLNLQMNTTVMSIGVNPDGTGFRVGTKDRGYIQTEQVLLATNAYTAELLPYFNGRIVPVRAQAIATQKLPQFWNYDLSIDLGDTYFHQQPNNGPIIIGGDRRLTKSQEYNNKDDSVLNPLISAGLISFLPLIFPPVAAAGMDPKPMYEWAGIMGFSVPDYNPWVGQIPVKLSGREGLWICAGFSGGGVLRGSLLGRGIGSWIATGNKPSWWKELAFFYDDYLPTLERFNFTNY